MSRDWTLFLDDIIQASEKIIRNTKGMEKEDFLVQDIIYDAVLRNLEVISEAAHHIPEEILAGVPEIDWKKIKGLRIILAHCYFRIDSEVLWDIITAKVPVLLERMRSLNDSTQ